MKQYILKMMKKTIIMVLSVSLFLLNFVGGFVVDVKSLDENHIQEVEETPEFENMIEERVEYVKVASIHEQIYEEAKEAVQDIVIEEPVELTIEERIRLACEEYGISYEITLAIARLETGWFKSKAYLEGNNPGGLSRHEKPMSFDTIEEGVEAFVGNLARNYFAIGLDTPKEIGKKYCPVNPKWASIVEELMSYEP